MLSKRKLRNNVRVTFGLSAYDGDESIYLDGAFNNWDTHATRMTRNEDGHCAASLTLKPDCEYQFRYLINERIWRNDPAADGYVRNPFASENPVVITTLASRPKRSRTVRG